MTRVTVFLRSGVSGRDRSLLVDALALATGSAASEIQLEYSCLRCGSAEHGKPRVISPAGWFVSLSRAGDTVGVAVTDAADLGLDLASVSAVSRADVTAVLRHPADDAVSAVEIARSWAAKEAVLKAAGWGLHLEASALAVADAELIFWPVELDFDEAPALAFFDAGADVVGSVAVLGSGAAVEVRWV